VVNAEQFLSELERIINEYHKGMNAPPTPNVDTPQEVFQVLDDAWNNNLISTEKLSKIADDLWNDGGIIGRIVGDQLKMLIRVERQRP
jgi:hypothetical protein